LTYLGMVLDSNVSWKPNTGAFMKKLLIRSYFIYENASKNLHFDGMFYLVHCAISAIRTGIGWIHLSRKQVGFIRRV